MFEMKKGEVCGNPEFRFMDCGGKQKMQLTKRRPGAESDAEEAVPVLPICRTALLTDV